MNPAHVHLWISHLPIFGSFLGSLVLIHGIWSKNLQTKIAAYNLFILSGIGAAIAYKVGEEAEEIVEHIQGVMQGAIETHEEFAAIALTSTLILAVSAVVGLIASSLKSVHARKISFGILILALISFGLSARTGYLGGKIRHTEIDASPIPAEEQGEEDRD